MAAGFNKCQITEAIQNLPPELREIIYKHYLTIKLKEREVLRWNLVHNELLIQPFCSEMERFVHIIVCVAYVHCCCGGFCYPCYKQEEILHEITISVPDIIDLTLGANHLTSEGGGGGWVIWYRHEFFFQPLNSP